MDSPGGSREPLGHPGKLQTTMWTAREAAKSQLSSWEAPPFGQVALSLACKGFWAPSKAMSSLSVQPSALDCKTWPEATQTLCFVILFQLSSLSIAFPLPSMPASLSWTTALVFPNLLSPRLMLTKVPGSVLSDYYHNGYPFTPKMADRPYNQYGTQLYTKERWDQLCAWLTRNPNFRRQLVDHKQALRDHMGYSQEAPDPDPSNKARRTVPPPEAPRRQRGLPGTVGPPHRPRPMGGPMVGGSKVVGSRNHPDQQPSPNCLILSRRWVALATLLLVA